jgi:7-cyano-7-deazaguanine synthase in queuosine biosynthesis
MKITAVLPNTAEKILDQSNQAGLPSATVALYARRDSVGTMTAGAAMLDTVRRAGLSPHPLAWDLASIALAAVTADFAEWRSTSPDGWTREFEVQVPVSDPDLWSSRAERLEDALSFLTTDRWSLSFTSGSVPFVKPKGKRLWTPDADCVALLSGGLDSLVGGIDLVEAGRNPYFVSHTVPGDRANQEVFAAKLGGHVLNLNHNVNTGGPKERSQRARSFIFIAYAILVATSLHAYNDGKVIELFVNENGYIAINPPLTPMRVGSLSTRTVHPRFVGFVQEVLDGVGVKVKLTNPYRFKTKGEMLIECREQTLLLELSHQSTSCGRYQRYGFTHCGRCLPCQIRRAAFLRWEQPDATKYVFGPLGKQDARHAAFDDVRSVATALSMVQIDGLDRWLGATLASVPLDDRDETRSMLKRGVDELRALHENLGVT